MHGSYYLGLEILSCIPFLANEEDNVMFEWSDLVKNMFVLQNIPSVFFFKRGFSSQGQDCGKSIETQEINSSVVVLGFFFPGNFRYYWLSGFVSLMGGWKMVSMQWSFQCKESMTCSFKVLSLSTEDFKMKSNSTEWLFPLEVFLGFFFPGEECVETSSISLVYLFSLILTLLFSLKNNF